MNIAEIKSYQIVNFLTSCLEDYYEKNGKYPDSLLSLRDSFSPDVQGIEKYYYEPSGKAYNIYFEQISYNLLKREIVMYNKLDEHSMREYSASIFFPSIDESKKVEEYTLKHEHWKYFLFSPF